MIKIKNTALLLSLGLGLMIIGCNSSSKKTKKLEQMMASDSLNTLTAAPKKMVGNSYSMGKILPNIGGAIASLTFRIGDGQ